MPAFQNLLGQRFGRLVVVSYAGKVGTKNHWRCLCDDGNIAIVAAPKLKSGTTSSCGCIRRETAARQGHANIKHGQSKTRMYRIWAGMMRRCLDKNCSNYQYWGGRGISVAERWHSFENFLFDMGERPNGYTLERINNDGPYSPDNCRWATMKEQQRNRRNNVIITHNGKSMCIREWAEETNIKYQTLYYRLVLAGWEPEKALF